MKISDLIIDWDRSIGNDLDNLMCVDLREAYAWQDGKKTDILDGWYCEIVSPKLKFDKVLVKVLSKTKPFEMKEDSPIIVKFHGLTGKAYINYRTNEFASTLTANSVEIIEELNEK